MKINKIILIIGLACITLLASSILVIVLKKTDKKYDLESELKDLVTDYYETDFKPVNQIFLSSNGLLIVDLDILEGMRKDISHFKEMSCDYTETFATISYDEEKEYTVEVHLDCKD